MLRLSLKECNAFAPLFRLEVRAEILQVKIKKICHRDAFMEQNNINHHGKAMLDSTSSTQIFYISWFRQQARFFLNFIWAQSEVNLK